MHKHFAMLREMSACQEGMSFVTGFKSLKEAWPKFERPDWMMWLVEKIGYSERRKLVLIATRAIRETPIDEDKFVFDILPKDSINPFLIIERYALGEDISQSGIAYAAADAAYAAADAARAAADAAAYAAADAARAAARAAADAAADAARAAAYAAADAARAAARAAADAAADAARKIQCDIIRSVISWTEVSKLINKKCKELGIE